MGSAHSDSGSGIYLLVMAGLDPAIHVYRFDGTDNVDARHKAGMTCLWRGQAVSRAATVRLPSATLLPELRQLALFRGFDRAFGILRQ